MEQPLLERIGEVTAPANVVLPKKQLKDLKFHESMSVDDAGSPTTSCRVMRVLGGFIYHHYNYVEGVHGGDWMLATSVFVPERP